MMEKNKSFSHHSVHLATKECLIAADYCKTLDSVVTVEPNCIALYALHDHGGCPRKVFHFEQRNPFSWVRVQSSSQTPLIATDSGKDCNNVLLWDSQKLISTLVNIVSPNYVSQTRSFHWSPVNLSLFSMGSDRGTVGTWDRRCLPNPVQQLSLVGGRVDKLQWSPSNEYLLAISSENRYIAVWDTRMVSGTGNDTLNDSYQFVDTVQFGLVDFDWHSKKTKLWTLNKDRMIEMIDVSDEQTALESTRFFERSYYKQLNTSKFQQYEISKNIMPNPHGKGILVEEYDRLNESTNLYYLDPEKDKSAEFILIAKSANDILCSGWRETHATGDFNITGFAVTNNGMANIFNWRKRDFSSSKPRDLNATGETTVLSTVGNHQSISKYSISGIKANIGVQQEKTWLDLRNRTVEQTIAAASKPVVGPIRFISLLQEELLAVEAGLRTKTLEGIRIGLINQFTRTIVLESLVPSGAISTKVQNFSFPYFSRSAYKSSADSQTVHLIITFPKKFSQFWTSMTFSIENKSTFKVSRGYPGFYIFEQRKMTDSLIKNKLFLYLSTVSVGHKIV